MKRWCRFLFLIFVVLTIAINASIEFDSIVDDSGARAYAQEQDRDSTNIAPFVPTPQEVVDRMLELAQVDQRDLLYDLGSGDGRIVITAGQAIRGQGRRF